MPHRLHGFPAKIRIPRRKSIVHIPARAGVECDEVVEITIPARTIGMRDQRRRPTRCENPGKIR
jgi:hypothetical protein